MPNDAVRPDGFFGTGRRVGIKVCGLTDPAQAIAVAEAGADWIGLNFHPPSPRFVTEAVARAIVTSLPPATLPVGLFVGRQPVEVLSIVGRLGLTIIQLHGDEPPEDVQEFGSEYTLVRAFRLGDRAAIDRMLRYLDRCARLGRAPDAVLVDAFVAGQPGGTGRTITSDLLAELPPLPRLILAGGLNPENVAERVTHVRPWMVDVAGGVESSPGRKDLERVRAFVRAAVRA